MGDTISDQDSEPGDWKSDDDDVDGVLYLVHGDNLLVVHVEIVCSSPFCSHNDRGVRCNEVVGVAKIIHGYNKNQCNGLDIMRRICSSAIFFVVLTKILK